MQCQNHKSKSLDYDPSIHCSDWLRRAVMPLRALQESLICA